MAIDMTRPDWRIEPAPGDQPPARIVIYDGAGAKVAELLPLGGATMRDMYVVGLAAVNELNGEITKANHIDKMGRLKEENNASTAQ